MHPSLKYFVMIVHANSILKCIHSYSTLHIERISDKVNNI